MQRATLAALTLAAAAGIPPAVAQDQEAGLLTATISQSAVVDTNYDLDDPSPGNTYYGDTRFGLDFLRQTGVQSLGMGFDTGLRSLWQAEEDFEFQLSSPSSAYFDFLREGPDTSFDAGFRLRSRRVDYLGEINSEGALPDDLTPFQEDSTEIRADADIGLILGTTSPSTYEFRLLATSFDYPDDPDPNNPNSLVPRRSVEGQALWTLAVTPVFSTALFGSYYYYSDETDDELRIAEAEAGLVYEPSEVLRIRGGLGYADRNREETLANGDRETTQHDTGLTARGDFRYIVPDWTLLGEARWTAAAPEPRLSGNLRAVYTLPRGAVTGRVFQRYAGGKGGDEVRITGAAIGLTQAINTVSRVDFDASYAVQVNEDDPDEPNIDRTDLTASYIYDFTASVSGEIGYGYRHRIEDPDDANSHRLFLVIGKSFQTGL
jgi:hypothetical protein